MKKATAILFITALILSFASFAGAASYTLTEKPLGNGLIQIYDYGNIKLHAFQSNDAMWDETFLLETATNLVAIESPAFKTDIKIWQEYVATLNKPLTDILLAYHPAGAKWYDNATSHATSIAIKSFTTGSIRQLIDNLGQSSGPDFLTDIQPIENILIDGLNTIGGIDFEIMNNDESYDIGIPVINAVYTHMLGSHVHSIMFSIEHMDATIATLQAYKAKGYEIILSGHFLPESAVALDDKIAYLEKTKELAATSANLSDFALSMVAAFPNYAGLHYLGMTAGALFPNK